MIIFIDVCIGFSIKPNQALGMSLIASLSSIFIAPNVMLADDSKITTTVQLDISINRGKSLDTVVLGLYGDEGIIIYYYYYYYYYHDPGSRRS